MNSLFIFGLPTNPNLRRAGVEFHSNIVCKLNGLSLQQFLIFRESCAVNEYSIIQTIISLYKFLLSISMQGKGDVSTLSSPQDQGNHHLSLRLINSENLTAEMAVNYLFDWRANSKLIEPLLARISELCFKKSVNYVPTIIFIMSLENNILFQRFCERMANESLSIYLLLRWSYSTYMQTNPKKTETMRNKLDSSLIRRFKEEDVEGVDIEVLKSKLKQKEALSNYVLYTNDFFQRLFHIPERLKKYDKAKRNERLRQQLERAYDKFNKNQNQYLDGIAFPIDSSSNILVSILPNYCFTFSTKERVPFKLVMETISLEDARAFKSGKFIGQQYKWESEGKQPYILPQSYFGKQWKYQKKAIAQLSKYSSLPSYKIRCYLVKSGDDLRQQYMAMQLIKLIQQIAIKQNLKIWVRSYSVIPFNSDSGLIEFIDDTRTVSYLKEVSSQKSLKNIYRQLFGMDWQNSISNFIQSLAGYSLIQYLFQIKDRHNNNILVDVYGHIIHIDFSFIISSSPGNFGFEKAPFKLTQDYIDIMQGPDSDIFKHFKMLFFFGLKYIRKYKKQIMDTILMMTHCKGMKCFQKFDRQLIEKRFHENATDEQLQKIVQGIVNDAWSSYTTGQYDTYQWYTNEIRW